MPIPQESLRLGTKVWFQAENHSMVTAGVVTRLHWELPQATLTRVWVIESNEGWRARFSRVANVLKECVPANDWANALLTMRECLYWPWGKRPRKIGHRASPEDNSLWLRIE
jgi:hypothetical protein